MGADLRSKPYSPDEKYKFVFLCKKAPQLRLVYQRREAPGQAERYIGFLHTAAGGIFQTNDGALAQYIREAEINCDMGIVEISHEELGRLLAAAPEPEEGVVQGAVGTLPASKREPEAPPQEAPREPVAAKAPRRRTPTPA